MTETTEATQAAQAAGSRAVRNTVVRAVSDLAGKVLSFVLFAVLARTLGQTAVGIYFFGLAFIQLAAVPVDLGLDRLLLRRVSEDRGATRELLWDVLGVKLALAVPVIPIVVLIVNVAGYDADTRATVYVLTLAMVVEALSRALQAVFMANERNELLATYFIFQRLVGTAVGLVALALGYGVVLVAIGYAVGAVAGLVVAAALMARVLGFPRLHLDRARWPSLARASLPFAVHESFTLMLLKLDAVMLSLLSTQAAVGRYGVASRLYESTFFVTFAITGAVAPMYVYLTRDSSPTVGAVFERSVKLSMVVLVPCSVAFVALGEPLIVLFFGESFRDAGRTLSLLGPSAVLMGTIGLCSTMISLRMNPVTMVRLTSAMVVLNVVANLVLQPAYGDRAAAAVMTGTLAVFMVAALRTAGDGVGGVPLGRLLPGPLLAGAAMLAVVLVIDPLGLAIAAGVAVYTGVLLLVEHLVAPDDLRFAVQMVRDRLFSRRERAAS
jgi:O-antigen/teichoic acid export membrane protein